MSKVKVTVRLRWSSTIDGEAKEKELLVPVEEFQAMKPEQLAGVEVTAGKTCPTCSTWHRLSAEELQLAFAGARSLELPWPGDRAGGRR